MYTKLNLDGNLYANLAINVKPEMVLIRVLSRDKTQQKNTLASTNADWEAVASKLCSIF